jgi:glutathione peroxidase-family protein
MKFNNKKIMKNEFINNIFDFSVEDYLGNTVHLQKYSENNPILIVNVASY